MCAATILCLLHTLFFECASRGRSHTHTQTHACKHLVLLCIVFNGFWGVFFLEEYHNILLVSLLSSLSLICISFRTYWPFVGRLYLCRLCCRIAVATADDNLLFMIRPLQLHLWRAFFFSFQSYHASFVHRSFILLLFSWHID